MKQETRSQGLKKSSGLGKYLAMAKTGFKEASAYRFNAVMSVVASVLFLVMLYAIWDSIAAAGQLSGELSTVLTYILVGQVVSNSVFVDVENYFSDKVREGTIVNELKRPMSLRLQTYFYYIGQTVFNAATKALPVALLGWIFLDIQFPSSTNTVAFIVSLIFSFNLVFSFSYLTSMLIFWTKIGWGIRAMRSNIQNVFSGVLFPLYLLPVGLQDVFNILPFKAMADGPITIFLGRAVGGEILEIFLTQIGWTLAFLFIGELLWRRAKKKITVQGG